MNARTPSSRPIAALMAAALALLPAAGCDRAGQDDPPPLAGAALGGPFQLTDQNGKATSEARFAGRYRAIYFGYSYCPDVCPTDLQAMMQGYRQFAGHAPDLARRLVPIFISVDPERDTPAVLKPYAAAFGPELVALTGTAAQVADAAKRYGAFYRAQPPQPGASGYLVDHSRQTILFGPDGRPIALIPTDDNAGAVAAAFARWVR